MIAVAERGLGKDELVVTIQQRGHQHDVGGDLAEVVLVGVVGAFVWVSEGSWSVGFVYGLH